MKNRAMEILQGEARWCSWLAYHLLSAGDFILKQNLDLSAHANEMASPQEKQ